jgi:hypothetical protein
MFLDQFSHQISVQLIRIVSGQLLSKDQIKKISSHAVGRHLIDYLPNEGDAVSRRESIELAHGHIEKASSIISEMTVELDAQKQTLTALIDEIDEKRTLAHRYAVLASTNQEAASAITNELENTLRIELTRQSEEGRTLRRIASISLWLLTLILGAAAGAYLKEFVLLITTILDHRL